MIHYYIIFDPQPSCDVTFELLQIITIFVVSQRQQSGILTSYPGNTEQTAWQNAPRQQNINPRLRSLVVAAAGERKVDDRIETITFRGASQTSTPRLSAALQYLVRRTRNIQQGLLFCLTQTSIAEGGHPGLQDQYNLLHNMILFVPPLKLYHPSVRLSPRAFVQGVLLHIFPERQKQLVREPRSDLRNRLILFAIWVVARYQVCPIPS